MQWIASMIGATVMMLSVSAYDDSQGVAPFKGLTASGATTRPGVAACGPSYFGKTLYVWGLPEKFVTCLDRGAEITDRHLDVWVETNEKAWGRGRFEMMVLVMPIPAPQVMPVWAAE